jgi:hypothetical protein
VDPAAQDAADGRVREGVPEQHGGVAELGVVGAGVSAAADGRGQAASASSSSSSPSPGPYTSRSVFV